MTRASAARHRRRGCWRPPVGSQVAESSCCIVQGGLDFDSLVLPPACGAGLRESGLNTKYFTLGEVRLQTSGKKNLAPSSHRCYVFCYVKSRPPTSPFIAGASSRHSGLRRAGPLFPRAGEELENLKELTKFIEANVVEKK